MKNFRLLPMLFLFAILVSSLFSGCAKTSVSDPVTSDTALDFEPTQNFIIEVDLSKIDYPETASVIQAKRIQYDYESGKSFLKLNSPELTILDERFDGIGKILVVDSDSKRHVFQVYYDFSAEGVAEETRKPQGIVLYNCLPLTSNAMIPQTVADLYYWSPELQRELSPYKTTEELSDLDFSDAKKFITDMILGLGVESANMPVVDADYTYTLLAEHQPSVSQRHLTEADIAALSDAYVFRFRQEFNSIPLNGFEWNNRIAKQSVFALQQQISATVSVDGSSSLMMKNLVSPQSYGEEREIVSPMVILEKMNEILSASLSEDIYYLSDIELCYAMFETDVRDELVLYPYWIIPLEVETVFGGDNKPSRIFEERDIYAFNAFTGELVNSVELPKE